MTNNNNILHTLTTANLFHCPLTVYSFMEQQYDVKQPHTRKFVIADFVCKAFETRWTLVAEQQICVCNIRKSRFIYKQPFLATDNYEIFCVFKTMSCNQTLVFPAVV